MRIHRHRNRKQKFQAPEFKINQQIASPTVRVIMPDGENRLLTTPDAIALAASMDLDLIEVSPKADPPVCRIIDSSSFKYQKEKEAKKQRAAAKEVEIKGIRISLRIGENDMNVRLKQAKSFLEKGQKLRIEMILRGREKAHYERALEVFDTFLTKLRTDFDIRVESPVKNAGGRLQTIVSRNA